MSSRRVVLTFVALVSLLWVAGSARAQTQAPADQPSGAAQTQAPPPAAAAPADQPAPAPAETTGAAPAKREYGEEIVVTGSRIRRKDLTTPAPVTVLSRDQVVASGKVSIGDFLQSLPQQGNALNTTVNNGGTGETRVNLRGLGGPRTLVLLNGRRIVGVGNSVFSETTPDLNTIPTSAIERIEVLQDGASAVYGSDAIGGVVNIITRKNFQGAEVSGYTGTSYRGDGWTYDANFTLGSNSDRGNILFNAGFYKQNSIMAGSRDYSNHQLFYDFTAGGEGVPGGTPGAAAVTKVGSSNIPQGLFHVPLDADGNCLAGGNATYTALCGAAGTKPAHTAWLYDPTAAGAIDGYRTYRGAPDQYNFQPFNYDLTPSQRISLFSTGQVNLSSDVRGYAEASFVNRQSSQQLAPVPLPIDAYGLTISKDSLYNPIGQDIGYTHRRLFEFPPRQSTQDFDTVRLVAGIQGTLPDAAGPLAGWFWDISLNHGRTTGTQRFIGSLQLSRIQAAIGPSMIDPATGQPICVSKAGDPTTAIADCTPLNLLHSNAAGNVNITPAEAAGVVYNGIARSMLMMTAAQANLSGELFKLLSDRPVGLAAGYEYRREFGENLPDPVGQRLDSTDYSFTPTAGGFYVNELYGELSIPVINQVPYVENLEFTAALRWSDYSTYGSNTTWKFGGRWSILRDITLRGTFSTAFRSPSIGELFLGAFDNFPTAVDPCSGINPVTGNPQPIAPQFVAGCAAAGVPAAGNQDTTTQIRTRQGGNPKLKAETADIFTLGVVLEPRWVKNLSLTVDYWNYAIDNAILNRGAGVILNACLNSTLTISAAQKAAYCGLIHRNATTTTVQQIDDFNTNVGNDRVDGIDIALRYGLPTDFGRFGFLFDATWLHKYDRLLADGTTVHGKGTFDLAINNGGLQGVYPDWKFNAAVTWGLGGFGAGLNMRFFNSFRECADITGGSSGAGACYATESQGFYRTVSAWTIWNAYVSYQFPSAAGRTSIAAGVNNLLNTSPPVIYDAFQPTSDPTAYDFVGRFFYLRLIHAI